MTIVVIALVVVVAVLALLVAGLLRSHAVILRRLHEAGIAVLDDDATTLPPAPVDDPHTRARRAEDRHDASGGRGPDGRPVDDPRTRPEEPAAGTPRPNDAPAGRAAHDLAGVTAQGDPLVIAVRGRRHDTSLLFLSADCRTCGPFWEAVGDGRAAAIDRPEHRLVVVTRGPEADLVGTIARRPADVPVLLSSDAWSDYEVPGSPYVVQVDGPTGRVTGEGTSASWEQLLDLADRGRAEVAARQPRRRTRRRPPRDSDAELRALGLRPGDPSLYPDRAEDPS